LIGFLGHSRQLPLAQERSRNLLTRARSAFLESYQPEKIAECENYLALAYWRTGETNEAESWIEESRSHDIPDNCDARLYSHVIRQLILFPKSDLLRSMRSSAISSRRSSSTRTISSPVVST
jgi:hypothetical protein